MNIFTDQGGNKMRINHNIPALNAHRQLNRNSNVSAKVLERLSSGKKINRAADDAAGMAISEKMKAQIRGLSKAAQNTMDGISLIQTAEGAMNEVHSMLQRMRELAVQSANGTVTDQDRKAIQDEVNQLTSEVNRIANGTEFNTRKVLRGNEEPKSNATVHKMSTGGPAIVSGAFDVTELNKVLDGNFTIVIDGEKRKVSLDSTNAATAGDDRAKAIMSAINDAIDGLGEANLKFNASGAITGFEIRSKSIGGNSNIQIEDPDATIRAALGLPANGSPVSEPKFGNPEKDAGNATATIFFGSVPEPGSFLTIGNEKIDFFDSRKGPYTGSNRSIDISKDSTPPSTSRVPKTVADIVNDLAGMDFKGIEAPVVSGTPATNSRIDYSATNATQGRLTLKTTEVGFAGHAIFIEGTPEEFTTNLQVGPNQGQGFRLSVGDVRANKLKISAVDTNKNTGVVGAAFYQGKDVTDGLSASTIEHAIDVSTEERATAAITVYDNAIVRVAEMRGSLGAIQNRLEYTAANLENTGENLTAALSRIEDTDMALEMSEFTKYNILIQAGTSMLAQANQRPQTVLQLLNS